MTDERMALIELVEKQADGDLVRGMLAFAAERIMELEVEARTGAAKGARSPLREVQRNGHRYAASGALTAYFRQGMSKRAIARHFCVSRDSVEKMIVYSAPPGYWRTAPVKRPKLDGFTEIIDSRLREDADRPRKQRHTAKRVLDRLREEHGFTVSIRRRPVTSVKLVEFPV